MIGQDKLITQIDNLSLDTFPRTLMLIGEYGSGKHTLCNYISKKLKLNILDITDNISLETITEIQETVEPSIYIINGDKISVKEENCILKFLEEPLKNSFIIYLCQNTLNVLPTILSRCILWTLQPYSKNILNTIFPNINPIILEVAHTPGQILEAINSPIEELISIANKIIDKISIANFSNTLTLSQYFNFKNSSGTYDIKLFMNILLYCANQKVINNKDFQYIKIYEITNKTIKLSNTKNIDMKNLFENYLAKLRFYLRGEG